MVIAVAVDGGVVMCEDQKRLEESEDDQSSHLDQTQRFDRIDLTELLEDHLLKILLLMVGKNMTGQFYSEKILHKMNLS